MFAATDREGRLVFVNNSLCDSLGYPAESLVGSLPPYAFWPEASSTDISLGTGQAIDARLRHANNSFSAARIRLTPRLNGYGEPDGWLIRIEQTRQSFDADQRLLERDHFIESVTRAVPEIIYVYDMVENRNVYTNRHIGGTLGFTSEQIQQMGSEFLTRLLHPDDLARLPDLFARWETARNGKLIETEYRMRDARGEYRWFLARDTVFKRDDSGKVRQFIGAAQDITSRKMAETARHDAEQHLGDSEKRYRLLADHSTDMISRRTPAGVFIDITPSCARILGYSPAELIGRSLYELVHPADRDRVFRIQLDLIHDRQAMTQAFRIRRRDGEFIWIESHAQPIFDLQSGEITEVLDVSRDVTDRHSVQEALTRSEQLFRALVENSHGGIAMVDAAGRIVYVSPVASRSLGYDATELVGRSVVDFIHSDDIARYVSRGPTETLAAQGAALTLRILSRDGTIRHLELNVTDHCHDPAIAGYIANFRDVTDQLTLEEQLRQAQKMEAIGQLAGGIAHDFNNILTAIIGNVNVMMDALPEADPQYARLAAVDKAARRASDLTNRLLGYSRRSTLHLRPCALDRIIPECLALLRPTFDPRIVFDVKLPDDVWPNMADADLISQVITNLCMNARDAMPRGGRLSLTVDNVSAGSDLARCLPVELKGDYVRLTVGDTGVGMPSSIRDRVFEPFFTTKPLGAGTGLGLAMAYGIMKAHGGLISCHSQEGVGTQMELLLPRSNEPLDQAPAESPRVTAASSMPSTGETILLVDDEPAIRTLGRFVLEQNGYRVLLAEDGLDAIETYREVAEQVDLVILDLTMPRLSGQDTHKQMREINPRVRVLFSSGYSAEHLDVLDETVDFINKPYRPLELLAAVRKHLVAGA